MSRLIHLFQKYNTQVLVLEVLHFLGYQWIKIIIQILKLRILQNMTVKQKLHYNTVQI